MSSTQTNTTPPPLAHGRAIPLLLQPFHSETMLGPAWAVLCGALAAGSWRFEPTLLSRLILTAFLAQGMWNSWRTYLVEANWRSVLSAHPVPDHGAPKPALPYQSPSSPVAQALGLCDRVHRWVRMLPVQQNRAMIAIWILPVLILSLSALIDWQILALSLAAIALTLIEWRVSWHAKSHRALRAGQEIGLSWLAGHVIFAPLTPLSLTLACCYAVAYQGMLAHQNSQPSRHRSGEPVFLEIGQLAALVTVTLTAAPGALLAGTVVGLLLAPQMLLLYHQQVAASPSSYLRQAAPYLMLSMAVAAWVV